MTHKADLGLIGLAVMGQNLVLNMNDHGFRVAVFNRTTSVVDEFIEGGAEGTDVIGAHSPARPYDVPEGFDDAPWRYDLADGKEILWMSQRDGWAHLYLYDGETGRVKNTVASPDDSSSDWRRVSALIRKSSGVSLPDRMACISSSSSLRPVAVRRGSCSVIVSVSLVCIGR